MVNHLIRNKLQKKLNWEKCSDYMKAIEIFLESRGSMPSLVFCDIFLGLFSVIEDKVELELELVNYENTTLVVDPKSYEFSDFLNEMCYYCQLLKSEEDIIESEFIFYIYDRFIEMKQSLVFDFDSDPSFQ